MRVATRIASVSSMSIARRSEACTVTGTTRSSGLASIMIGRLAAPVSSARNSVWPGWAKPASYSAALLMGLVTTPLTSPRIAKAAACRMDAMMAGALAGSLRPATAGTARRTGSTGRASANTEAACAALATSRTGTDRPSEAASAVSRSGSSSATNAAPPAWRASQVASRISPPMPAGSPIVTAKGGGGSSGASMRFRYAAPCPPPPAPPPSPLRSVSDGRGRCAPRPRPRRRTPSRWSVPRSACRHPGR